jgi:hypothetical protein
VAEFRVEVYTERALTEMSIQIEPAAEEDAAALSHHLPALFYVLNRRQQDLTASGAC